MIKHISSTENLGTTLEGYVHVDANAMFTHVALTFTDEFGSEYTGFGASKRASGDEYSSAGYLFSLSRALRDLADHVEVDAREASGEELAFNRTH